MLRTYRSCEAHLSTVTVHKINVWANELNDSGSASPSTDPEQKKAKPPKRKGAMRKSMTTLLQLRRVGR